AIKYFSGSHDQFRTGDGLGGRTAVNRFGGPDNDFARMKARLAWSLCATALGTPMMFMGTEHITDRGWRAFEGYNSDSSDAFVWQPSPSSREGQFMTMVKHINRLRLNFPAMYNPNRDSALVHADYDNGVCAFKRWDGDGNVFLITINISDGEWKNREYQFQTGTPNSVWKEVFNSQYWAYGGWLGSGNSDPSFYPTADGSGLLQGINLPLWSLMILKQQL
ncbi:MAG: alpha amylase C-terminal domain-containing protein, partial [Cyanobacteria bacterium J06642_11]